MSIFNQSDEYFNKKFNLEKSLLDKFRNACEQFGDEGMLPASYLPAECQALVGMCVLHFDREENVYFEG